MKKIVVERSNAEMSLNHLLAQLEFYNPSQKVWIFSRKWMLMPEEMRLEKLLEAKRNVDQYLSDHPMVAKKRKKEEERKENRKKQIALRHMHNGFPS